VLQLASLSDEQRAQMGRNARAVSASEFNRDRLIGELEARLGQLAAAHTEHEKRAAKRL
jgi:hypothetical protein